MRIALDQLVSGIIRWARENVVPVTIVERGRYQQDDVGQNARSVIEAMRLEAERLERSADQKARSEINQEARRHTNKWTAGVSAQAQIDVRYLLRDDDLVDLLSVRSEEFNRLIRNLSQDVRDRIERQTLSSIFEGKGNAEIAKSLQEIGGIGRNRARLIARDQASKLNAAQNQFRQEQAGVTLYKWRTILDGRERPTHNANNGKLFRWDKPPPNTGHPSQAINCRCRALAYLGDDPAEIGEQAVPGDIETASVESNEVLFSRVASTPTQNVFNWTPQSIGVRQEELNQAKEIVAAYKASSRFNEENAAELAEIIYGSLPSDDILSGLYGSRAMASFVSRRTLLMNAVNERLELVERLLAQVIASRGTEG